MFAALTHLAHHFLQMLVHLAQGLEQLTAFVLVMGRDGGAQVASRGSASERHGFADRAGD